MVDGHAVLFHLCPAPDEEEFRIVREYEGYCDIRMANADYAIVKNLDGFYGVINSRGELVVPDAYESVSYSTVELVDSGGSGLLFLLEKDDGTQETFFAKIW